MCRFVGETVPAQRPITIRLLGLACAGALAALGIVACGGEEAREAPPVPDRPVQPPELPEAQRERLFAAEETLAAYCRQRALSASGRAPAPSRGEARRAFAAADRLAEVVRRRPFHLVQTGVDVRLFVGDLIENLEGLRCDERLPARLREPLL